MPFARRLVTAFAVVLASAGSLAAQNAVQGPTAADPQLSPAAAPVAASAAEQAPIAAPAPEQQPVSLAPFAANATVGMHAKSSDMPGPIAPPRADTHSTGVTMMIIGGAALVAGALIGGSGGTVIAVGGVVVGAIGLYKYLQ
jgi:hypothetical protein